MVARDLDVARHEAKIWNCVSSSKPGTGGEDERYCITDASVFDERRTRSHQMARVLPTVEMVINSLPNRSTGYSPFFLVYGYHPVLPVELLKGDEERPTSKQFKVFREDTGGLASSTRTDEEGCNDTKELLR